jgi:hypothetical protein
MPEIGIDLLLAEFYIDLELSGAIDGATDAWPA